MQVTGAVTEFNPFHSGHAFFLESLKKSGADAVICVMSGTFVQRGSPAVMLPGARAKAALMNGADLVIELPLPWAMARAQRFALGGVSLLEACGVCDTLGFGSECADIELIKKTSAVLQSAEFSEKLKSELCTGISFAAAREKAAAALLPGAAKVLSSPNDILAAEYLGAVSALGSTLDPLAVKRLGAGHDCAAKDSASAAAIREMLKKGQGVSVFMPESAHRILSEETAAFRAPALPEKLDSALLYKLRTASEDELRALPDVSEGLESRIADAARQAADIEELLSLAKTKRYSHARLRRIILSALLGLTESDAEGLPPYIRVLGFNSRGRELLSVMKKSASLPVIMKYSDTKSLDEKGRGIFALQCRAADVYSLCLPSVPACGIEQKFTPVIIL